MDESERRQMGEAIGNDIDHAKHRIDETGMISPLTKTHEDPLLDLLRAMALEQGVRKDDKQVMGNVLDLFKAGLADGPVSFNPRASSQK
jgi:hypothetical protein